MKNQFKFFKDKRILITGGFGFIGKSFIKRIIADTKYVFILDDLSCSNVDKKIIEAKNLRFIKGDVRNRKVFDYIPKVDYVVHLGSPSSIILFNKDTQNCIETTINGLLNVIDFSIKNKVKKMIFPSSGSVYGSNDYPYSETIENPHPINIYGKTKLTCEYIAKIYHNKLPIVILRIFAGFGPEENHKGEIASVVTLFVKDIINNKTPIVFGDGFQERDFVWIDDIVDTLIQVMVNNYVGILNVGSGVSISFNEDIRLINQALGENIKPKYINKPTNYLENTKSDINLLVRILKRKPFDPRAKIFEYAKTLYQNSNSKKN